MSRNIYFVTHPDVVIDPAIPVPQWPLTERAGAGCGTSSTRTGCHITALYCSTEQKAIDGAAILSEPLGMPFQQVAALGENDRSATGYLPKTEFEATANAFFARPSERVRGWERAIDAQARIIEAVEHIVSTTPGAGPIGVCPMAVWGHSCSVISKACPSPGRKNSQGQRGATTFFSRCPKVHLFTAGSRLRHRKCYSSCREERRHPWVADHHRRCFHSGLPLSLKRNRMSSEGRI